MQTPHFIDPSKAKHSTPGPCAAKRIERRLLVIDEGRQQLSLVDTGRARFAWTLDLAGYPLARDLQRLDRARALVGFDHGFLEVEIDSGRVLAACARWRGVTAAARLADGSTLVTGFDLDGAGGINVLTIDGQMRQVGNAHRPGNYVRLMRTTPSGTCLLCMNDHILETDSQLNELRRFSAPGFEHAWKAERLPGGSTLVAAGYGAFMAEFGPQGQLLRTFGGAAQVDAEVAPFFYASFATLDDGGVLVANWQGHGPDHGGQGRQLLEFDATGVLRGSWSAPERISSLQGILVL